MSPPFIRSRSACIELVCRTPEVYREFMMGVRNEGTMWRGRTRSVRRGRRGIAHVDRDDAIELDARLVPHRHHHGHLLPSPRAPPRLPHAHLTESGG